MTNSTFPGKIAVITNLPSHTQDDEETWAAAQIISKYSTDKAIHVNWPSFYTREPEAVKAVVASLAVDREIKVLIMNQAVPGCNAAIETFKKIRDDIFVVYCVPHESFADSAAHADLILRGNEAKIGLTVVKQAKKQGAKAFVHYSFPRHMSALHHIKRRDLIRDTCAAEGLLFVDATALDPIDDMYNALQFILGDVPRRTSEYGEDTAFYSTNCFLQEPLIKAVMDSRAIYPQPCCPSPYHGFLEALGIEAPGDEAPSLSYTISESRRIIAGKNMTGRLSTWPVSLPMMLPHVGAEYAIKWLTGQVPERGIDDEALLDCMGAYVKEVSNEDIGISMTSYSEEGVVYDNFKMFHMDYLNL